VDLLLITVFFAGLLGWGDAAVRKLSGRPIIAYRPRRPVPWGLAHLLVAILMWFLLQVAAIYVLESTGQIPHANAEKMSIQQRMLTLTLSSLAALLATGVVYVFIRSTTRASGHDFGIIARHLGRDLFMGLVGFVMLVVPVLLIQYVLTVWFPTKHPLIVMLKQDTSTWLLAQAVFSAVIVAPVFEEFFVRILLQGWLENVAQAFHFRASGRGDVGRIYSDLSQFVFHGTSGLRRSAGQPVCRADSVSAHSSSDFAETTPGDSTRAAPAAGLATPLARPAIWPILVSAGLFALAHWGHGPDPIPLFVLAVGLGYMYQRTHRILPCMVVHFLLNGFTMLQIYFGPPAG
jgi:membrane protease YdiL (CAAX protease family)